MMLKAYVTKLLILGLIIFTPLFLINCTVLIDVPNETIQPATASEVTNRIVADYPELFNQYRASQGLYPLIFTNDLTQVATVRLAELQQQFGHNKHYKYIAENIVRGVYNNKQAFTSWINSPLHNENMLNTRYKHSGYAIGGGYAVQVFSSWDTIDGNPQLPEGWSFPE